MSSTRSRGKRNGEQAGSKSFPTADLISSRQAAELVQLDPREQFYVTLWSMVQCFDPATAAVSPLPEEHRFPLLTGGEFRRLRRADPASAEEYVRRKARRDDWARRIWLVVPAWGGRKGPCSEWRFSARRCRAWGETLLGGAEI
jgi:hypothetical protein